MVVKDLIKKNLFVIILFSLALTVFLIQHSSGMSWDFICYVLNARYYLGSSFYFEPFRPPLTSILLILLGFGTLFSEYSYIIFVSALHLFSSYKFCKVYKLNFKIFYAVSITPSSLLLGLFAGTELLSLALLQLFIAYLGSWRSGLLLGLASLTRYTNLSYTIILFFNKHFKKIIKPLIVLILVLTPWLLFNWLNYGDPLLNIIDQYAQNIGLRAYLMKPPNLLDFVYFFNYTLPLIPLAVLHKFKNKISKIDIVMIFSLIFEIYSFIRIPLREPRYLFAAIMPASYFITKWLGGIRRAKLVPITALIITIALMIIYLPYLALINVDYYKPALNSVDNCMIMSNAWVYINYFGFPAMPFPYEEQINSRINEGYRLLLYKWVVEPDYVFNDSFISQFKIIANESGYYLLGDSSICKTPYVYDLPFLWAYSGNNLEIHGYGFNYTIWNLLG